MLQEFLDANLLPITDEGYFEKLKKTADEIAKKLIKDKTKVLRYTLTAIDPEVSADNPDVIEVKGFITKKWSTFSTNSKDTPMTFIRAVMLEALELVSKETSFACLIWLTGRNIQPLFKLIGKEKELIAKFLLSLGNEMEKKATENWSLPSDAKLQKLTIQIKEITGVSIDKTELENHLIAASGQTQYGGENPGNTGQQYNTWHNFFSQRASQGLTDAINKVLKQQTKEINANQTLIQEAVNKLLVQTQSEISERNGLLQMRIQLLWWKESCYSISLDQSFRGQQNGLLQILLANDYSTFVPAIYPTSADYFLRETHRGLVENENKKTKVSDILQQVEQLSTQLKAIFSEPTVEVGRISLLNFIKGLVWGKYNAKQFKEFVGFADSSEMTLSDFTVWLFHDLQSIKISTSK